MEAIRPYLRLLNEQIQPSLYSGYNRLAEWRKPADHRHFETFDFGFVTSPSEVTNHLPPVRIFHFDDEATVASGSEFIAVSANSKIQVFSTQLALHRVAELDVRSDFNKAKELKDMSEIALNTLSQDR